MIFRFGIVPINASTQGPHTASITQNDVSVQFGVLSNEMGTLYPARLSPSANSRPALPVYRDIVDMSRDS